MKNNKFLLRITVINVICFFVGVYFYYLPPVYSQEVAFLSPPYFGSTTVNAIFDHEYPLYDDENDNGFNGDVDTMVHRTNERLANLAAGVVDANRYCVGYSGHDGIDYGLRYQYVLSSHDGEVVEATWDDAANHRLNLGLQVTLQTDEAQYRTIYGHLSTLLVEAGQQIDTETVIGISGSTGFSSEPHLHFTLQKRNGQTYIDVNPYGWGSAEQDPWIGNPPVRPASENMWENVPAIQNRNLGGNFPCTAETVPYDSGTELELLDSQDPRLIPDLTAVTTYILDDSDDEFTAIGLWETDNCATDACYEDDWHHTTTSGITAVWHRVAGILYAQEYDLYAYIPQGATTTQASYKIIHNNTAHWAGIRQNSFSAVTAQDWAYIGRYEFNGNGNEYVQLTSMNEDGTEVTGADALAFVLAGLPPSEAYMTKVSLGSGGQNPAISGNGQYLAYYSNSGDIMRYDHVAEPNKNEMVVDSSFGSGSSIDISDDGNYIAYAAPGPHFDDVFLYEHSTGNVQNLTDHPADSAINYITNRDIKIQQTNDSLLVGYTSSNILFDNTLSYEIWLYDSAQGATPTLIDLAISGSRRYLHDISANGEELLIGGEKKLYVYNRAIENLETIPSPVNADALWHGDFSSNGRYLTYNIDVDVCNFGCYYRGEVYWHDRVTGDTEEIYSGYSDFADEYPRISDNGRYVTYIKGATNIYRYDRDIDDEDQITLTADGGNDPNASFYNLGISSNGRFVTFSTDASNLVANDSNNAEDVFLADTLLLTDQPTPTATPIPTQTPTPSQTPPPSGNGLPIARDGLEPGWANWSWGTASLDLCATTEVHTGSCAVAVDLNAWGGLSFHHNDFATDAWDALTFQIHGGSSGGQQLWVYLDGQPTVSLNNPAYIDGGTVTANSWKQVSIPLADLGGANSVINRLSIQAVGEQPPFYVDEMQLAGSSGLPTPTPPSTPSPLPTATATLMPTHTPTPSQTSPPSGNDLPIARDGLETGWDNWSWGASSLNLCTTTEVHTGSCAVAVDLNAWGGLSLHHNDFATDAWDSLTFQIHGGSSGGQQLRVYLNGSGGVQLSSVSLNNAAYVEGGVVGANSWKQVTIPLADLGGADTVINRITIQAVGDQPLFYVDEMYLQDSGGN